MKTLIRHGVFETNSSSCHTLVFGRNPTFKPFKCSSSELELTGNYYGWGYEKLTLPMQRMEYVATLLYELQKHYHTPQKDRTEWSKDMCKYANNNYDTYLANFESVIKEFVGVGSVTYKFCDKSWSTGIDHQSCEDTNDFDFLADKSAIKTLLFGSTSKIIISHDN